MFSLLAGYEVSFESSKPALPFIVLVETSASVDPIDPRAAGILCRAQCAERDTHLNKTPHEKRSANSTK